METLIKENKMKNHEIFKNENGEFQDKNGNIYYEEKILRYRVMSKYVGPQATEHDKWRLSYSSSTLKGVEELMNHEVQRMEQANYKNEIMKVVDNGEESSVFSLMY